MKTQDMGYLALKAQTEAKVGGGGPAGRAWRSGQNEAACCAFGCPLRVEAALLPSVCNVLSRNVLHSST